MIILDTLYANSVPDSIKLSKLVIAPQMQAAYVQALPQVIKHTMKSAADHGKSHDNAHSSAYG